MYFYDLIKIRQRGERTIVWVELSEPSHTEHHQCQNTMAKRSLNFNLILLTKTLAMGLEKSISLTK